MCTLRPKVMSPTCAFCGNSSSDWNSEFLICFNSSSMTHVSMTKRKTGARTVASSTYSMVVNWGMISAGRFSLEMSA